MPEIPSVADLTPQQLRSLRGTINAMLRINRNSGRNGGRPLQPTPCPRCGVEQPSWTLAQRHCKRGTAAPVTDTGTRGDPKYFDDLQQAQAYSTESGRMIWAKVSSYLGVFKIWPGGRTVRY